MVWTLLLLLVSLCFAWAAAAALIFSLRRGTRPTRSRRVACRTDLIRRNDEHDDTCCRLDRFLRTEKHRWLGITSSISNTLIPLIINIDTQQRHEFYVKNPYGENHMRRPTITTIKMLITNVEESQWERHPSRTAYESIYRG
ncbi:Os06g0551000 [Oryza sativa Japonica Group]|jgi:hypothetical protein|uniref:Os06g0551000 protein n=2 Tax=Oryza sativa subsp. japonica TaxID=39947 RepID=Q0DBM3_ORYSJ|nr:Os06g0551000 [Oryza sativa Japonica Group]BAS98190.1 Os06g0551000 [Oryza sativa Japonica Group]|eukprot:NP_001057836.1 Os06g0551000 [Oryza sativa Japonica Group]